MPTDRTDTGREQPMYWEAVRDADAPMYWEAARSQDEPMYWEAATPSDGNEPGERWLTVFEDPEAVSRALSDEPGPPS